MKPLLHYFSCVLRVIVLLEGKPSAQSEVLSTLEKVFVQDIPVLGRIHLSLDCNQSSCPHSINAHVQLLSIADNYVEMMLNCQLSFFVKCCCVVLVTVSVF